MKFGYGTITWGIELRDTKRALASIADAGFKGVEFAQRPNALGVHNIYELLKILEENDLELIGLSGGTLKERMDFCQEYRPFYLQVDTWNNDLAPIASAHGFVLAIHPRKYIPVSRLSDAQELLKLHQELQLIIDCADLTITGEDPNEAIRQFRHRIAAIRLKDWTPEFGRSNHRYGRGFTELGKGIVSLESITQTLKRNNYDGWIVVEIDNPQNTPQQSIEASSNWLIQHNYFAQKDSIDDSIISDNNTRFNRELCSPESEARFREAVMLAGTGSADKFYSSIGEAFNELIPCKLISILTGSSAQGYMAVLSVRPQVKLGDRYVLKIDEVLSGITIERFAPATHFDVTIMNPGKSYGFPNGHFGYPHLLESNNLKEMISIPIYNSGNQNHVRFIVNLFPENANYIPMTDNEFYGLSRVVTFAAETMLDNRCLIAAGKVNLLAGHCEYATELLDNLRDFIQEYLDCEGVAIFMVNEANDRLELVATTGTEWFCNENDHFYKKNEGLTGMVWDRNEAFLTVNSTKEPYHKGKSEETCVTKNQHSCLWVPLVNAKGKVVGVVRCRNKRQTKANIKLDMFSDDDAAVLDTIGYSVVPHLELLLGEERRVKALGILTHELKMPIVAIRGATEFMQKTPGIDSLFDYDYLGDIWSWSELFSRMLVNTDLFRELSQGKALPIRVAPTLLKADVIAPAVRHVKMLLKERGFSANNINYGRFEQIPQLWIDKNLFQQIIFNLLSNAIKYCFDDVRAFNVDIWGIKQSDSYNIIFKDTGRGITKGMEEMIFQEGFRTPEAIKRNVTGQGIGLWIVRKIIVAHGGRIRVTSNHMPTQFTIYLPESLAKQPRKVSQKEATL